MEASELFDPEVVIDFSQNVFNPDVYRGYEGLMRLVMAVHEMWDMFKVETDQLDRCGRNRRCGCPAVRQRRPQRGRHPDAVLPVWTLRDGRVLRMKGYLASDVAGERGGSPARCR